MVDHMRRVTAVDPLPSEVIDVIDQLLIRVDLRGRGPRAPAIRMAMTARDGAGEQ